MPVPVCRTVQDAYEAGRADALAEAPAAIPELAAKVAELIAPWLEQIAAQRGPKLLTIAQAEVDAFIARHRVGPITTRGGRNW
jgi:hypothetical protein